MSFQTVAGMVIRRVMARKPFSAVESEAEHSEYKRPLKVIDLMSIAVGATIGAGIFALTGQAAKTNAGPAIVISYLISGFACVFACLCYAELGSMLPVSGGAYSFTYCGIGELMAWIVGWDLLLEYLVSASTVAVAWGFYFEFFIARTMNKNTVFDQRFVNA
eukprot:jgi/Hompol1/2767/HPOL_001549-RA